MIVQAWQETHLIMSANWLLFLQSYWLAIVICTVCVALVVAAVILSRQVKLGFNLMRDTLIPLSMVGNGSEKLPGKELEFFALDGRSLRGVLLRGKASESGEATVIFCHEFGSNKHSCLRYCKGLLDAGFDVFSFDFRNHGNSSQDRNYTPRQWPTDKEVADVLGACAFVKSLYSQGHPIGLFGVSRGGGSAILAAAQSDVVRAIITDGAFSTDWTVETSIARWAKIFARTHMVFQYFPQFRRFFRWLVVCKTEVKLKCRFPSIRKYVGKLSSRPILFIHGKKDSYINPDQARRIYEKAKEPKFLWIVPKAKHNQAVTVAAELYCQRTTAFFREYLLKVNGGKGSRSFAEIADLKPTRTV